MKPGCNNFAASLVRKMACPHGCLTLSLLLILELLMLNDHVL